MWNKWNKKNFNEKKTNDDHHLKINEQWRIFWNKEEEEPFFMPNLCIIMIITEKKGIDQTHSTLSLSLTLFLVFSNWPIRLLLRWSVCLLAYFSLVYFFKLKDWSSLSLWLIKVIIISEEEEEKKRKHQPVNHFFLILRRQRRRVK